jgi:glycerophosphoryl diester phosphodiesterase
MSAMTRAPALLLLAGCAGSAPRLVDGTTRVIVHRGGKPEGTIAGGEASIAAGIRFLEFDVRLTKDGHAVILHDPTVDRTTDGKGAVADLTLAELKKLDAGGGRRVPTVFELLRAVGSRAVVLLELKVPGAAKAVMDAVRDAGAADRAVIRMADRAVLRLLRAADARLLLGTMSADVDVLDLGLAAYTPLKNEQLTREAVARLRAAGIAVWGTNTNDEAAMRRLVEVGVDGIITDSPDLLFRVLRDPR